MTKDTSTNPTRRDEVEHIIRSVFEGEPTNPELESHLHGQGETVAAGVNPFDMKPSELEEIAQKAGASISRLAATALTAWAFDKFEAFRLSSPVAAGVRVKPLEWRKLSLPIDAEAARTAFGDYRIGPRDDGRGWYAFLEGQSHLGPFSSDYGARNAAQADLASRILSSIDTAGPAGVAG